MQIAISCSYDSCSKLVLGTCHSCNRDFCLSHASYADDGELYCDDDHPKRERYAHPPPQPPRERDVTH